MALLANLRHLQKDITAGQPRAHGKADQVDPLHNHIFTEGAVADLGSPLLKCLDGLIGQQTHLAVPFSRMRIIFNAKFLYKMSL